MSSILTDTKKTLGIPADYTAFDIDILIHINSVLAILNQLGIGPEEGFEVQDSTAEWSDFLGGDPLLNNVKTYVYLRVRLLFDPPSTSYLIEALTNQYKELEYRISIKRESLAWIDPTPPPVEDVVYDGGTP